MKAKPSIHTAAKNGKIEEIQTLITDDRIDINTASTSPLSEGHTALEIACKYLNIDTINFLLQNGAVFREEHISDIIYDMLISYHSLHKQLLKLKIFKIMIENGVDLEEFSTPYKQILSLKILNLITRYTPEAEELSIIIERLPDTPLTSYEELVGLLHGIDNFNAINMVGMLHIPENLFLSSSLF